VLFVAIEEVDFDKLKDLIMAMERIKPPEGVKLIGDYATLGGKGVMIIKAEKIEDVFKYFAPVAQYFKRLEVYPALPCEEMRKIALKLFR